jgi:branched-chain amino acid transport system substrate-binding protein
MKIGILYPRSKAHPGITADFVDGIKTALQQQLGNQIIQLMSESISFGGQEKEVYEKAEKLLLLEGADVLVAFIDLRILEIIKPLLYASGKLVLVVNPGANYPENWIPQPNIINLTLQHAFLCWLTGKIAAQMKIENAAAATTFYDCGYLHTAAMVKGFVNDGGNITYNYVHNGLYDDSFEIKQLTDYLSLNKETDSLLCVFDSSPASLFYSKLNNYSEAGSLHLFVSPMMLEQAAMENRGGGFKFTVNGYLPWHTGIETDANSKFMEAYLQQTKREATVFSLLGWETGLILQQAFLQSNESFTDGTEIAAKLAAVKINSPRGNMKLDKETNYFIAPVHKCTLPENEGKLAVECIEDTENEWKEFTEIITEGVSSGWTNTYLCY